ncbi:MAG: endo-1,4-beta-xylanase [Bacteroidetes bacterium]|nr:endo-1,4-beta-xylanase [Bacteroidota bacterium]
MTRITRRRFLTSAAFAGLGAAVGSASAFPSPSILTRPRTIRSTAAGNLEFRPYPVQRARGPHLLDWAYASDVRGDAFHSNITASAAGVTISDTEGKDEFAVEVRWNVEGFGYLFLTADNGGEFYRLPHAGRTTTLHLGFELARSRVSRNQRRLRHHTAHGYQPSRETRALLDLSEGLLEEATKSRGDAERCAAISQRALLHALHASELLELEKCRHDIGMQNPRKEFLFGCDARAFYEMDKDHFLELFSRAFNYATITHVWTDSDNLEDFEPAEGQFQFGMRDLMLGELRRKGITVEGRPLFWFHTWVTPGWLKTKSYDQLLSYVERTTRQVVQHYGDSMYAWEIVNELHDWANECGLRPEQTVELTRLACDVAKAVAPNVHRLVNNCCPFAEYVQLGKWSGQPALYPQRTPWQFTRDLVDAGVDFTLLGQQMYFPYRDIQDIALSLERLEQFKRPVQISEIGAPGGPTEYSIKLGKYSWPKEPYAWRRHWDEELQADWLEGVFTVAYSKSWIEAANWFDFVDPYHYIENGGLLRSPKGETKAAYDRLLALREKWNRRV